MPLPSPLPSTSHISDILWGRSGCTHYCAITHVIINKVNCLSTVCEQDTSNSPDNQHFKVLSTIILLFATVFILTPDQWGGNATADTRGVVFSTNRDHKVGRRWHPVVTSKIGKALLKHQQNNRSTLSSLQLVAQCQYKQSYTKLYLSAT